MIFDNKFAVNCDWLQIHVKHEQDFLAIENPFFYYKRVGQSKVFREIYNIHSCIDNRLIGTYATGANENIMSVSEGILKIENRELYIEPDLKLYVKKLLKRLHLKFIGITRLDIAFDFQKFYMDLNPEDFIKKFIDGSIVKTKDTVYGHHGKTQGGKVIHETLSFGKKSSNVCCKLYNKTKELANNFKPHIDNRHREIFDMDCDIWRLEFSLYSMNAFFRNQDGKEYKFYSLDILDKKNLYAIFIGLFKKYFRFKIPEGNKRLTRCKDVVLWIFELSFTELKKIAGNPALRDSSRSERIFIKKLNSLNNELRLFDENFEFTAKELITKMCSVYNLTQWAKDNGYPIDENKTGYASHIGEFTRINEIANEKKNENFYQSFDII